MPTQLPAKTRYRDARKRIKDGDQLVLNRPGMIPFASRGTASHTMTAVWWPDDAGDTLGVVEAREGYGIRWIPLVEVLREFPGMVDVYRPKCERAIAERAATIAKRQCGKRYDWRGIGRMVWLKLYLLRLFFGYDQSETKITPAPWYADKYCCDLSIWIFDRAIYELGSQSKFRLVQNIDSKSSEPADIPRSGSCELIFRNLYHNESDLVEA